MVAKMQPFPTYIEKWDSLWKDVKSSPHPMPVYLLRWNQRKAQEKSYLSKPHLRPKSDWQNWGELMWTEIANLIAEVPFPHLQ